VVILPLQSGSGARVI